VTLAAHRRAIMLWSLFEHGLMGLGELGYSISIRSWLVCVMILAGSVVALGSSRTTDDYVRTTFTVEDGLPDNVVNAIIQTGNGLLWVGTDSGLATFDGREFTPIDLHIAGAPHQGAVESLVEASNGDLWVGTHAGVVLIPRDALDQFDPKQLIYYQPSPGASDEVESLYQTRDGAIWVGTNHGLYRKESGKFVPVISATSVNRIAESLDGHLLLITGRGFVEWDGHRIVEHPGLAASLGVHDDQIINVSQDRTGTMWYCTETGIVRRGRRRLARLQPYQVSTTRASRTYEDPQGDVWVLSGIGLYRAIADRLETPASDIRAWSFYPAKDGELWVGTNGNGLIRLKHRVVRMYTSADGLPNDVAMAVLSSHDGKIWVGGNCGLSVFEGERFKVYREKDGLLNSCVWALAEDQNRDLWIGTYGGGLFRFRDGHFGQYSMEQGLVSKVVLQIAVAHDGSLWIATPDGVSHMKNGHFQSYTVAEGLSSNHVFSVYQDRSGSVWAQTQGGIDRLVGERFVPLPAAQTSDGPLSIRLAEDSFGDLYTMNSPKGISLIENNLLIAVNENLKVRDMVESSQHDLWFSGIDGIIRIALNDLKKSVTDRDAPLDYARFDRADGMNSIQCSVGAPNMAITPDNKLWVATVKGLAMLDLVRLQQANTKPKVFVGAVTIGKSKELAGRELVLAPGTHHVELHLEAVDLASSEKVRLQYRMDSVDAAWLDADATRTAIYTNIPVGTHAFHVRASGSDGAWDRIGILYNITQRPYFYQTTWFRLVSVSALVFLLFAAYLIRVRHIIRQTHIRHEERLVERERIARELHDTLLQSFQGLTLHFQRARNLLPGRAAQAIQTLDRALDGAEQAIVEGRDAIHDLRSSAPAALSLAEEITSLGEELVAKDRNENPVQFRVVIEGSAQTLHQNVHIEIFRIAREGLRNAFCHSHACRIETEIAYTNNRFRLRIRDDGKGIDPDMGKRGERTGHWGLAGMRERAQRLSGELDVWSEPGAGTEVDLRVPASIAYQSSPARNSVWLFWKKTKNDHEHHS
jgi:signal transduction histidine kinase/ligand-binding sensor domain-containing protein